MPTTITEIEDETRGKSVLRVEGSMTAEDAALLERIALDLRGNSDRKIAFDLSDLDFLDSEGAPILIKLVRDHGFEIEGMEYFLQTMVNEAEKKHA